MLRVNFRLDGTADASDYEFISSQTTYDAFRNEGTIIIPAGASSVTLRIRPTNDTEIEEDESVIVRLDVPTSFSDLAFNNDGPYAAKDFGNFSAPAFADLDGNGTQDLLVGRSNGDLVFVANSGTSGTPNFGFMFTNPFGLQNTGDFSKPVFYDFDDDGDQDILVGLGDGMLTYFSNVGTTGNPNFIIPAIHPFNGIDVGLDARPAVMDVDGDNDPDLIIGNRTGILKLYTFQTSGTFNGGTYTFAGDSKLPLS